MKTTLPLTFLASVCFVLTSTAQFEPYPEEEQEIPLSEVTVTLYSAPDFRGDSITLVGDAILEDLNDVRFDNGRRANNRVSSIWIEGHAHVSLFDFADFRGESITLMESEADLDLVLQGRHGDWDNDISSLTIETHSPEFACEPGPIGGEPYPVVIGPSHPEPTIPSPRPVQVIEVYSPYDHHYRMDPTVVRKIDRAYQDVLRRSPDEAGRKTYYWTMIERDWSESRLRKELRKSDEYHQQTIPAVVKKVYREVLGREPDPAGFQFYTQKMSRDGWYESRLRDALKRSPEYASRGRSLIKPTRVQTPTKSNTRPRSEPVADNPRSTQRPSSRVNPPASTKVSFPTVRGPIPTVAQRAVSSPQPIRVVSRPTPTPKPTQVVSVPKPRSSTPQIPTRKSSATPPKMKTPSSEKSQPKPPRLH
ncbi:MAG: hypothetical protein SynsKO_24790 [Synoicihabitans sp.]